MRSTYYPGVCTKPGTVLTKQVSLKFYISKHCDSDTSAITIIEYLIWRYSETSLRQTLGDPQD